MIALTLPAYLSIGFILALILVAAISYFDEGDNDEGEYMTAGLVGLVGPKS
jgi:hypothetical protein